LWLAIRDIEDKRARQHAKAKQKGDKPSTGRRLIEGASTNGWKAALNQLELLYPDRLTGHIN